MYFYFLNFIHYFKNCKYFLSCIFIFKNLFWEKENIFEVSFCKKAVMIKPDTVFHWISKNLPTSINLQWPPTSLCGLRRSPSGT